MKLNVQQSNILKHMTAGWTLASDAKNEPFLRSGIMTQSVSVDAVRDLARAGFIRGLSLFPTTTYILTEAGRKAVKVAQ